MVPRSRNLWVVCFNDVGHGAAIVEEAQTTARRTEVKNLRENIDENGRQNLIFEEYGYSRDPLG